jgi:hypothetical protein
MAFSDVVPAGFPQASTPFVDAVTVDVSGSDQTFSPPIRGFYVGTPGATGSLSVTTLSGAEVTFAGLLAGHVYWVACSAMRTSGTTATNVLGLR